MYIGGKKTSMEVERRGPCMSGVGASRAFPIGKKKKTQKITS